MIIQLIILLILPLLLIYVVVSAVLGCCTNNERNTLNTDPILLRKRNNKKVAKLVALMDDHEDNTSLFDTTDADIRDALVFLNGSPRCWKIGFDIANAVKLRWRPECDSVANKAVALSKFMEFIEHPMKDVDDVEVPAIVKTDRGVQATTLSIVRPAKVDTMLSSSTDVPKLTSIETQTDLEHVDAEVQTMSVDGPIWVHLPVPVVRTNSLSKRVATLRLAELPFVQSAYLLKMFTFSDHDVRMRQLAHAKHLVQNKLSMEADIQYLVNEGLTVWESILHRVWLGLGGETLHIEIWQRFLKRALGWLGRGDRRITVSSSPTKYQP